MNMTRAAEMPDQETASASLPGQAGRTVSTHKVVPDHGVVPGVNCQKCGSHCTRLCMLS
jgi:hypothetical protein